MEKRALMHVLILALGTFSAFGQAIDWKDYEYAEDGFRVSAPVKPSFRTKAVETSGPGGQAEMREYTVHLTNDCGVQVTLSSFAKAGKISPAALPAMRDYVVKNINGKLLSEKTISLDNNPGIEFEVMGSDGYHGRLRYYIAGNKVISLTSFITQGRPLPEGTVRILDSFRLVKTRSQP
jgi:hypothetical protein